MSEHDAHFAIVLTVFLLVVALVIRPLHVICFRRKDSQSADKRYWIDFNLDFGWTPILGVVVLLMTQSISMT